MRRGLQLMCVGAGLLCGGPVFAQQTAAPPTGAPQTAAAQTAAPQSPILTIDSERLFLNSAFGMRVAREIEARGVILATENRQIEAALAEAEQDLTDMRATMTPEQFRPLADAFDTRVQDTRQAQAGKSRALNALLDQEREIFLRAAGPVLEEVMAQAGASVVMERRSVFISTNSSDITAIAIARLNETLGEGAGIGSAPQAPQPRPPRD
jgi:Skp family chaperone for outer membrane proteins